MVQNQSAWTIESSYGTESVEQTKEAMRLNEEWTGSFDSGVSLSQKPAWFPAGGQRELLRAQQEEFQHLVPVFPWPKSLRHRISSSLTHASSGPHGILQSIIYPRWLNWIFWRLGVGDTVKSMFPQEERNVMNIAFLGIFHCEAHTSGLWAAYIGNDISFLIC